MSQELAMSSGDFTNPILPLGFELSDIVGVYRGNTHKVYTDYTQPVFSYDQKNWIRIPDVVYDTASLNFRFTHTFTNETAHR